MRPLERFHSLHYMALVVALVGLSPRSARADVTGAARAFAEGQSAQLEGKYALAAERFELAFTLQPSKEALRSAARMQMSAENFARAATHAQGLLDRFADDPQSAQLARTILQEVSPRLARYEVSCTPACSLLVDNLAYFLEPAQSHRLYLPPGRVLLGAQFASGRKASRTMLPSAGQTVRLELHEPAPPSPRSAAPDASIADASSQRERTRAPANPGATSKGVPVIVPWITGAATVACGAVTIWSALDTKRQHDDYVQHPTDEKWQAGLARQRMTNVFLASTAVLAATTVTLTFFVRDSGSTRVGIRPTVSPTSASLDLSGRF